MNSQKLLPPSSVEWSKTSRPKIDYSEWDVSDAKIKALEKKYPWYPILMNWIVAFLIFCATVEIFAWAVDTHILKEADALSAAAIAEYQAEREAADQARRAEALAAEESEQARREADIILMSKMLYGINKFVETYGYSENDIRTYAECAVNRVLSKTNGFASVTSIQEAILQKDQWVGFDENNQVLEKYYKIASVVVNNFYDGATRPCSSDFCYAELTRNGIWLKNEFSDDKYVQTWRYVA